MQTELTSSGRPVLLPHELSLREVSGVRYVQGVDQQVGGFFELYVTSHRLLLVEQATAIQIPLHNIGTVETAGGWFRSAKLSFRLSNFDSHPFYVQEACTVAAKPLPPLPSMPQQVMLKFNSTSDRDVALTTITQARSEQAWKKPTVVERLKVSGYGLAGVKTTIKQEVTEASSDIGSAFTDLESLKEKSRKLVELASKLKQVDEEAKDPEIAEIRRVMGDLGFTSGVSRDTTGVNYFTQLARDLIDFIMPHLQANGGLLTIFDVFCLYNRARGTNLISPQDLQKSCENLTRLNLPVIYKELKNGVRVLQLASMHEDELLESVVKLIRDRESMSELELSEALKINPLIAKQCLINAEDEGYVARDESMQGLRFYENLMRQVAA
mmetsp:Transcript_21507/g.39339  ORF Transcript_21507/g.39339 Transcript_21507/m.39339 type:complete len:383 (+) Transcript_21507:227-1375(+)|eukprot:CAMPEP_0204918080 /NCGR_PEP_ID=MMETSP1397-20131031/15815_1 /ASSEMBLY_ACC=CAM_ASM_000891 /TAXON_ID=49980 /ORGANISM="Climacostomum Climacostomum virens, Strain Stock W-24" /LENGTH=382 /DNA_ID=CAMNT_0052091181 /DNA_START=184 /DNA_END=1332 /DNA_ORIENTATION=-